MANNDFKLNHPPIFVCGVQRAGTTLLVKMLNKSESISFLPQETHLFPLLWNPSDKIKLASSNQELANFLRANWEKVNYGWTLEPEFLEEVCDVVSKVSEPIETANQLLEIILKTWELKQGSDCTTGEKTPAHIFYARKKLLKFPESKIILMCRDPRAAALSEKIKLENNDRVERNFNTINFIGRYIAVIAVCKQLSKNKNVLFVRYEDLISSPKETITKVTKFLGVEFKEEMLTIGVTNSSFQDKKQKGLQFNSANLDRWKSDLPKNIIGLIEYHLGDVMKDLNYEISSETELDIPKLKLLKQKAKLKLAVQLFNKRPAFFHHHNRNKKYKQLNTL